MRTYRWIGEFAGRSAEHLSQQGLRRPCHHRRSSEPQPGVAFLPRSAARLYGL